MRNNLIKGNHFFVRLQRRTDGFQSKRYSDPKIHKWEQMFLKGELVEERGDEVKLKLIANNNFEKDGQEFIFHKNDLLIAAGSFNSFRSFEEHGNPHTKLGVWIPLLPLGGVAPSDTPVG